MRSKLLPLAAHAGLLAAALVVPSVSAMATDDVKSIVIIKNDKGKFVFTDTNAKIKEGQTIKWVAVDGGAVHQLVPDTEGDALTDTGTFDASAPVTQKFGASGTIKYHCAIHPKSMRGTITVTAAKAAAQTVEAPASTQAPQRVETKPKKPKRSYGYSY